MKETKEYKKAEEWLWSEVMDQKLSLLVGGMAMMTSSYANQGKHITYFGRTEEKQEI